MRRQNLLWWKIIMGLRNPRLTGQVGYQPVPLKVAYVHQNPVLKERCRSTQTIFDQSNSECWRWSSTTTKAMWCGGRESDNSDKMTYCFEKMDAFQRGLDLNYQVKEVCWEIRLTRYGNFQWVPSRWATKASSICGKLFRETWFVITWRTYQPPGTSRAIEALEDYLAKG